MFSSSALPVSVVEEDSCFVFVLSVEEEFPQPVNAKSTEMARDAAIAFFNFIEFVLSVLFFMSLNLLFNFILFVLVYLLSAFFLFENP